MTAEKIDLKKYLGFLCGLAIWSTWVSQSVLDLATSLMSIIAIFHLFSKNNRFEIFTNKNLNKIFPWIAGYFFVACLGYYFNGRKGADIIFNLSRFSWIPLLYVLAWAFRYIDENEKSIRWYYVLLSVPALYGFNVFFNDGIDYLAQKGADGRIIGFVQSATYHSHIGGFFLIVSFTWLYLRFLSSSKIALKDTIFKTSFFYWLVAFTILLTLIFSRTRGVLISVLLTLAVLFWILHGLAFIKKLVLPLVVFLIPLFLFTPLKSYIIRSDGDFCRVSLALVHIEMLKTHPLLGIGYRDNMRNISDFWPERLRTSQCEAHRVDGSQAHNQLINVAGTTGILGLITYLAFIVSFIWLNINWYRKTGSDLALICLIAQIYFQLSCMTEITFEFAKIRFLILCVWALVVAKAPTLHKAKVIKV